MNVIDRRGFLFAAGGIDTQGSLARAWLDMNKMGVRRVQSSTIGA